MSLFLQNFLSLIKINFFLLVQKTFIDILFLFSIFRIQVQKISTNLFFKCQYITYILQVFTFNNIIAYIFIKSKSRLYDFLSLEK